MSNIYKVNYVVNGKIETIIVFNRQYNKKDETDENDCFTPEENERNKRDNIKIITTEQIIHFDDSIGTIKIKILNELIRLKKTCSLDEIYLYCQQIETFNPIAVYQSLTQNKKLELTKIRLDQFISNIVSDTTGASFHASIENKDVYTFEDILEMKFNNKQYIVNKVLGQKFFIVENEYPFICDPYDVNDYDSFFERSARKTLSTLNNNLLLNAGPIISNNIYLCLAEDVLKYVEEKDVSQETTLKIYYPFLYRNNIKDLEDLESSRDKLIESNKKVINDKTTDFFKTIDMFYGIYQLRKSQLEYERKGIKYIRAVLKPEFDVKIPLEVIFKILHATKDQPLIKYNSSARQENVYRLYTDATATDGRKIPYLKKATIFKLIKNIGKSKSVSVYIETESEQTVICEFDEYGYITITSELKEVLNNSEIDELFINTVNPVIDELKNFLEQNGYKLERFNSLKDNNVEVRQMTYETHILIKKPLNIDNFKGCISAIFTNETNKYKSDSNKHLRFKRVANFSKVSSQEAFILEKSSQGYRGNEIIQLLLENFPEDLDMNSAVELVRKVANEIQLERGVRKSEIKIKENPGFKTIISLDKEHGRIIITVENINDIYYLDTIPIYLDTMVRLTQDKTSTSYPVKEINKICGSGEKETVVLPDIISSSEESASSAEIPSIEDEDIEYTNYNETPFGQKKPKGVLSLFYDEDEEEEEDMEESGKSSKGGVRSDNSEESIPSERFTSSSSSKSNSSDKTLSSFGVESPQQESEKLVSDKSLSSFDIKSHEPELEEEPEEQEEQEEEELEEQEEPEEEQEEPEEEQEEPEEEQEEPEEEQEEYLVQPKKIIKPDTPEEVRNIDGMKLNKPYYFQKMIENKDPVLILKEDTKEFNSYSRTCSSDQRRQPVILTDSQLDSINKEHPDFLGPEDVIKYGSDPNNKYNYVCPRYWCLKNNTIVDPKDLKEVKGSNGKTELEHPTCGRVLSRNDKKVRPGYYIYEFYDSKKDNPNFKKYPGLIPDKHPDGYCLPCCFTNYNTEGRISANKQCFKSEEDAENRQPGKKEKDNDEYIKGPDKFPIEKGRFGYLPMEIQQMLRTANADCQISKTNTNLKENHPCLLRHGVELNKRQSFIACISDALFFNREETPGGPFMKILSIKEMRQRIIDSINIDSFIKYQNGNLVTNFYDNRRKVDINKYKDTKIFKKLNMSVEEDKIYYTRIVSAFENFTNFLQDDDSIIDHTYLWDIICVKNIGLFPRGLNLVIFNLPDDDITNNVQMLCPTNHYTEHFYDSEKPSLILMKKDGYYEPIYSYTNKQTVFSIKKFFSEKDPKLTPNMRAVINEVIKPVINATCKPLESMPNIYKAKRAINLYDLIEKLNYYKYSIIKLVLNFNNKVIGLIAKEPGVSTFKGFLPCYPSMLTEELKQNIEYVFMTELSLWNNYNDTIHFLNNFYKRNKKGELPFKPAFNIIEDEHVVGILTETNQFVQLSEPIRKIDIDDSIPSINNDNYLIKNKNGQHISSDAIITTSTGVDKERVDYIKKIKLETNFYNVFRNTIRILLNDYENLKLREQLENTLQKEYIIYSEKLRNVTQLLEDLVKDKKNPKKDKIQFIGDEKYYELIQNISTCIVKDKEKCSATPNLCAMTENGHCNLILPEKNLLTGKINEPMYYGKMADELIRYNRIKSFMLQPQTFLSFSNVGYNLRENEIILIQSLLTQEYFETLTPMVENKYVKYNSYDEVEPINTQMYENTPIYNKKLIDKDTDLDCIKATKNKISSSLWEKCFPSNYIEIESGKTSYCTFSFIINIIERKTGEKVERNQIKNILYNEYKPLLSEYTNQILDILITEGKGILGKQVKAGILSFEDFIYADNYFLTTFDLWLLVMKYKIPTIFISQYKLFLTKDQKHEFVAYSYDNEEKFVFIIIPGYRHENVPNFKFVQSNDGDIFIPLDKLEEGCSEKLRNAIITKITVEYFLQNFIKPKKTFVKSKPNAILIDDNSSENLEEEKQIKQPIIEITPQKEKRKYQKKDKNIQDHIPKVEELVEEKEKEPSVSEYECEMISTQISSVWKNCFPNYYEEVIYKKLQPIQNKSPAIGPETIYCNYSFVSFLIKQKSGEQLDMLQIKSALVEEYQKYIPRYLNQILDNLEFEKKDLKNIKKIKIGSMSLKDWIDSDKYYLTLFDLWLLVQRYRIPTIFIRNTENSIIYQTDKLGDKKNIFIGYGHLTDDFVFINMPGYFAAVPNIAYIHSKEDGHIFIPLDKLNQNCIVKVKDINVNYTERIRDAITGQTSVEDYLKNFKGGSLGTIILDDNGYDDNLHYGGNKTKKNKSKNHNITKRH